jgi:hypothetical protein
MWGREKKGKGRRESVLVTGERTEIEELKGILSN